MLVATLSGKIVRIETRTDKSGNEFQLGTIVDSVWDPITKDRKARYVNFRSWGKGPMSFVQPGDYVTVVGDMSCSIYTPQNGNPPRVNYDIMVKHSFRANPGQKQESADVPTEPAEPSVDDLLGLDQ